MATRKIVEPSPRERGERAFIDLEASGLNARSWPIEVGWAFETGDATSMLIAPHDRWPEDAWETTAAALHGLEIENLRQEGLEARDVCAALNDALGGVEVYSDAPEWD
ncbi:MAG: hypothetical protein AAGJ87_12000, partial [Pseudomonadota bacterium]